MLQHEAHEHVVEGRSRIRESEDVGPLEDHVGESGGLHPLPPLLYEPLLEAALREDLGRSGDITSAAVIPEEAQAVAHLVARGEGRVAGLEIACRAFTLLDPRVEVDFRAADGDDVAAATVLAVVLGPARAILSAERVALNVLGRLCGIATQTRRVVALVAGTKAKVAETRKTTPGLRALEKYAVRVGGGSNQLRHPVADRCRPALRRETARERRRIC